jgi:pimeloyl-ACP methyl ester carboxylesterase
VLCCVTDGVFGTYTTLVPYMQQWFRIYNSNYFAQSLLPPWYYGLIGLVALRQIGRERGCDFVHLEKVLPALDPRPILMVHGDKDTYIRPVMARALYDRARGDKEFWLVPSAKHNQALQVAGDEYRKRVLDFFERHLGSPIAPGQDQAGASATRNLARAV